MIENQTAMSAEEILDIRAEKYGALPDERDNRTIIDSFVLLRVGLQTIAISSNRLERISKTPPIAHLPGLPRLVRGTLQSRGELLAAVEVARWFDVDSDEGGEFYAVVVHPSGRKLALLVDQVIGIRDIAEEDLVESFLTNDVKGGRPVLATTRNLVALIDVDKMFDSKAIVSPPGARQSALGDVQSHV